MRNTYCFEHFICENVSQWLRLNKRSFEYSKWINIIIYNSFLRTILHSAYTIYVYLDVLIILKFIAAGGTLSSFQSTQFHFYISLTTGTGPHLLEQIETGMRVQIKHIKWDTPKSQKCAPLKLSICKRLSKLHLLGSKSCLYSLATLLKYSINWSTH